MLIVSEEHNVPKGYRPVSTKEIMNQYLSMDIDGDYRVSKNEWMLTFINLLGKDINSLEKEGPDAIMKVIDDLSAEFDKYDLNNDSYLQYEEYKRIATSNIYISE